MIKLLLVDDEIELREMLAAFFSKKGLQVTQAINGVEALEYLGKDKFTLVVSDVRMPEMDGIELIKKVRSDYSSLPFIFLSGFTEISQDDLMSLGATNVFPKPVKRRDLLEYILKMFEGEVSNG
jgi:YesN/AraC family two-component response regulator